MGENRGAEAGFARHGIDPRLTCPSVFEHWIDAVVVENADGRITDVNGHAVELLGLNREELVGSLRRDCINVEAGNGRASFSDRVRGGEVCREVPGELLTGLDLTPVILTAWRLLDERGGYAGRVTVARRAERVAQPSRHSDEMLADNGEQLKFLLEGVCQAYWEVEPDGEMTKEMPPWGAYTGQTAEEMRGFGWARAIHPEDRERVLDEVRIAIDRQVRFEAEYRLRRYDGEYRWTSARVAPVPGSDGGCRKWVGLNIDISARKAAETALRETEARFRILVEKTAVATWETTPEGLVVTDLPSWRELTGQTKEETLGAGWADALHPDDQEPTRRRFYQAVRERSMYDVEYRVPRPGGGWRWTQAFGAPIFSPEGEVRKWVGMNIDITDRKNADEALRRQEELLRIGITVARLALVEVDYTNDLCYPRPEAIDLLGLNPNSRELPRSLFRSLLHPEDREEGERETERVFRSDDRRDLVMEFRIVRGDGTVRWCGCRKRVFFSEVAGQTVPSRGVLALLDVTERRRDRRALEELNATLERRVSDRTERLRKLAIELTGVQHRERKRLAAILHDGLQQLLVAVRMNVLTAKTLPLPQSASQLMSEAEDLLNQAIRSSRELTSELRPPVLYEDGLVPALRWLASRMRERHHLAVEVSSGPDLSKNLDDGLKALVFESVSELLFNVVKHAGVSKAEVALCACPHWLGIEVSDRGVGMRDEPDTHGGANAFGLLGVRERMAALGGSLDIRSSPGAGTDVTLTIPLPEHLGGRVSNPEVTRSSAGCRSSTRCDGPTGPGPAASGLLLGEKATPESGAVEVLKTLRTSSSDEVLARPRDGEPPKPIDRAEFGDRTVLVLVVDDHAIVRQGVANIINSDSRLAVVAEACDAELALEYAEQFQPHVVLVDVNLPGMNGIELTRVLRSRYPAIALVGLSVHDDTATARSMIDAGADAFISKTDDSDKFISTVVSLLDW